MTALPGCGLLNWLEVRGCVGTKQKMCGKREDELPSFLPSDGHLGANVLWRNIFVHRHVNGPSTKALAYEQALFVHLSAG